MDRLLTGRALGKEVHLVTMDPRLHPDWLQVRFLRRGNSSPQAGASLTAVLRSQRVTAGRPRSNQMIE